MSTQLSSYILEASWPLIFMSVAGLGMIIGFLRWDRANNFKGLLFLGFPGVTFSIFSLLALVFSVVELRSAEENFFLEANRSIEEATPGIVRLIKLGQFIELHSLLADAATKANLISAKIYIEPKNSLVVSVGATQGGIPSQSLSLVDNDIDGSQIKWGALSFQWNPKSVQIYAFKLKSRWINISAVLFCITVLFSTIVAIYLFRYLRSSTDLISRLGQVIQSASSMGQLTEGLRALVESKDGLFEEIFLKTNISILNDNLSRLNRALVKQEADVAVGKMASQVIHDVRSPLSAIKTVSYMGFGMSSEAQSLLKQSCGRVEEILADLKKMTSVDRAEFKTNQVVNYETIQDKVSGIIAEKKILFPSVKIEFAMDISFEQKVKMEPIEFKRMLSNLIQNAGEAVDRNCGKIKLQLEDRGNFVGIIISDNGHGINKDLIPKLGDKGVSFGKNGGSGMGLWHARKNVELWGGAFNLDSEIGKGTSVLITLPKST